MTIAALLKKNLKETCVYWGNPVDTGYGGVTYDDPVELKCRWEDKVQILGSITGNQIVGYQETSRATVYVLQDIDQDGVLWLGELADLDAYLDSSNGSYIDPKDVPDAHIIKRIESSPSLGSSTDFLRKAFLTPWLT